MRKVGAALAVTVLLAGAHEAAADDARQGEQWAVAQHAVANIPGAWELSRGAGAVVAVIDTGTTLAHPDLAPNVWTNFDEVAGNGLDDDGNGYVDDVHGIDLTRAVPGQDVSDPHGHGTHVAGIIAAAADGRGVVGVAPQAKVMTIRALGADGVGTTAAVAEGIRYAAANGARVVNMSLGGDQPDPRLQEAIAAAAAANVLVVCSAGNAGRDIDQVPSFPVSVPAPNLIGVAATAPAEGRSLAGFSNFGRLTVSVAAPGERVLSTANDGTFTTMSGTSMAAPHVSGVAALMVAVRPDMPASDLRAAILANAVPAPFAVNSGYLDARDAVLAVTGASSLLQGQRPKVRVLRAQRSGRGRGAVTRAQVGVEGATEAIVDFRIRIDGRQVAVVRKRAIPFWVRVRGRSGARLEVQARAARGRVLASGGRPVRAVRRGKRDIGSGGDVRPGGAVVIG